MRVTTSRILASTTTILLLSLAISSCSDGGGGALTTGNPAVVDLENTEPVNPATNQNLPSESPVTVTPQSTPSAFPFRGTITLDEYDWFSATSPYLGVVDITLSPLDKKRLLDGSQPRRHSSGSLVYRQSCGTRVHRILVASADLGASEQVTPCSSNLENPGFSPTDFGFSALSPDGRSVAVEALYYLDSQYRVSTVIYDTSNQNLLRVWDNLGSPMWFRDGSLLLSGGEGFYTGAIDQETPVRLADGLTSSVANPALHPTDDIVAFEYNQQIWLMNTDGTNAREAIYAGSRLRYPAWSPDGNVLAYLSLPNSDHYVEALFFTDLVNQTSYSLDLNPVMSSINASATVNGPLTWR